MRFAIVANRETETNLRLIEAMRPGVEAELLRPADLADRLGPADTALARIDVLPTVDGVEPGSLEIARLEARGAIVLNRLRVLLSMHDKLLTSRVLAGAGVPHPRTEHVSHELPASLEPPLVLKPRFGSWGADVHLCRTRAAAEACLEALSARSWFRKHGVLAQELIPPMGHDLRIVVAGGRVVGAVERVAAPGEWRTNIALGGTRRPAEPPPVACELALSAATAAGADLVGIDLLPTPAGGWVALELNGAVEFNDAYSLDRNVFSAAAEALVTAAHDARSADLAAAG
jgi:RimK family alpha-L-glutamate ligase